MARQISKADFREAERLSRLKKIRGSEHAGADALVAGKERIFDAAAKRRAEDYSRRTEDLLDCMDRILGNGRIAATGNCAETNCRKTTKKMLLRALEAVLRDSCLRAEQPAVARILLDVQKKCPESRAKPSDEQGMREIREGILILMGAREALGKIEQRIFFDVQCEEYENAAAKIYTLGNWLMENGAGNMEIYSAGLGGRNYTAGGLVEEFKKTALVKYNEGSAEIPDWAEYRGRENEVFKAKETAGIILDLLKEASQGWASLLTHGGEAGAKPIGN